MENIFDKCECKECGVNMLECKKLWKEQRKCCPDCRCSFMEIEKAYKRLDEENELMDSQPLDEIF